LPSAASLLMPPGQGVAAIAAQPSPSFEQCRSAVFDHPAEAFEIQLARGQALCVVTVYSTAPGTTHLARLRPLSHGLSTGTLTLDVTVWQDQP
jgi:hypothetical protein